jgi:hypothetical protein
MDLKNSEVAAAHKVHFNKNNVVSEPIVMQY